MQDPSGPGAAPPPAAWQGPMAWVGAPPRPVENYSREFPAEAVYVRGEVILTLAEPIGPGTTRDTERAVPALISLERGAPVEVRLPGLDGRCWVYRRARVGRKVRWHLLGGEAFEGAAEPVVLPGGATVERAVVQSVLPMAGTRRYVSLLIDDEGRAEDLSASRDPDPDD